MSDGFTDSIDLIEQAQAELQAMEFDEEAAGMDRREFVFLSLVAAAATTLGTANVARAQGRGAGAGGAAGAQQAPPPPIPLGNAEPPAEQFMPYPGGTGALMQKLIKERGAAAFERATFKIDPWSGPMPATDDDLAFLPTHRQAALIQSKKTDIHAAHEDLSRPAEAAEPDSLVRRHDHGRARASRGGRGRRGNRGGQISRAVAWYSVRDQGSLCH